MEASNKYEGIVVVSTKPVCPSERRFKFLTVDVHENLALMLLIGQALRLDCFTPEELEMLEQLHGLLFTKDELVVCQDYLALTEKLLAKTKLPPRTKYRILPALGNIYDAHTNLIAGVAYRKKNGLRLRSIDELYDCCNAVRMKRFLEGRGNRQYG